LGYIALFSGMAAIFDQDSARAIELYEEALQRCRASGNRHGEAMTLIRFAMARSHLGDSQQAVSLAEDCIAVCDAAGDTWHKSYALTALGIEMWRQGDFDRAAALEKESLALNRALDDRLGIMLNLAVLALAACSAGSHQNSARLLGALESLRQSLGVSLKAYTHLGAEHDACVRELTEALGEHNYQKLLHEGVERSVDEILDLGGGRTKDRRTASGQPEAPGLTRRERQIAELVAQGMSNKEIASTLTIALRTAESHVEHILVKLGFTSRTRIIAWVNEQADPPAD
jgi:DNA-binding CsgD family transcriptional regulator